MEGGIKGAMILIGYTGPFRAVKIGLVLITSVEVFSFFRASFARVFTGSMYRNHIVSYKALRILEKYQRSVKGSI